MALRGLTSLIRGIKLSPSGLRNNKIGVVQNPNFWILVDEHRSHFSSLGFPPNLSRFSATTIMTGRDIFNINDYDIIGFDLDNTVLRYNLPKNIKLEYNTLAEYLIKEKGYDESVFARPVEADLDFLIKGLMLDVNKGNILQIGANGSILKASHGTRFLTEDEIKMSYGPEKVWDISTKFVEDPIATWNGPLSEKLRCLLDYFDMPASIILARIVDSIDAKSKVPPKSYNIYPDILAGLVHLYTRDHFYTKSEYFKLMRQNVEELVLPTKPNVIRWLKELKKTKATFLLTGSNIDFANLTATKALGKDWCDLFDIVVCFARKPGHFFEKERTFYQTENLKETSPISSDKLVFNGVYTQGNWIGLKEILSKKFNANKPRCLYVGDNLIQDVYTPSYYGKMDTISVSEEMLSEGMHDADDSHEYHDVIKSNSWTPYFGSADEPTIWSGIIRNHSKICIPSLEYIASNSIQHEYDAFTGDSTNVKGFYPSYPKALLQP